MTTVKIFQFDGTGQCGMGKEISLDEMEEKLKMIGGKIIQKEKRTVPYIIPTVCGAPTGAANVYTLPTENWELIKRDFLGTLGFALWVFDTARVLVYKYDGTLQCGMGKVVSVEEMAKEFEEKAIQVHNKYKSTDGAMHIALCGASTGQINVYEIDSLAFPAAQNIGFQYLTNKEVISVLGEGGEWPIPLSFNSGGVGPLPW
jgi:hypothetical protein